MVTLIIIGLLSASALSTSLVLLRLTTLLHRSKFIPIRDTQTPLPTVSVCIPARNETHAMTECLERVLASDYEKLEVIVLDDSSVDDTSVLIKSFAHAGVRFVEGSPLPDNWLGKNHALEELLGEASSKYVLFLDVDTILQPYSIRQLISWAIVNDQDFVSVVPQRADGLRASVFLGTLRYLWLLLFQGKTTLTASSAAWLVNRTQLIESGGFNRYKNIPQPEIQIANDMLQHSKQTMIVSNQSLGVTYEKKWTSQVETSVRLLKPTFGGTLMGIIGSFLLIVLVITPFGCLYSFIVMGNIVGISVALMDLLLITLVSLRYYKAIWRYGWWLGALHWPLVVIQEAILLLLSIWSYSRGVVTWKGRPVTNLIKR